MSVESESNCGHLLVVASLEGMSMTGAQGLGGHSAPDLGVLREGEAEKPPHAPDLLPCHYVVHPSNHWSRNPSDEQLVPKQANTLHSSVK